MYIRPSPPFRDTDAHYTQMASEINDGRLAAGRGIRVTKSSQGTTISVANPGNASDMHWAGTYNFTSSYNVNDVVYVDPSIPITDQNGAAIPFGTGSGYITPGLFICSMFVPALGFDDGLLTASVAPVLTSAGQQVTSPLADTFRHYALNVYYPTLPVPAGATYVTESTWTTVSGSAFWLPLLSGGSSGGSSISETPVISVQDNYTICGGQITALMLTGTGSGGTSGTYNLGFTGSGAGAAGTYTVSSSIVQSLLLTYGGYGYSGSVDVTFNSGSIAGASAEATAGPVLNVALPRQLQRRTFDGLSLILPNGIHTLAWLANGLRTDTSPSPVSGSIVSTASIWPPYLAPQTTGSVTPNGWNYINIYQPPGGTGLTVGSSSIIYMEVGTERHWENDQAVCIGGTSSFWIPSSNPSATQV